MRILLINNCHFRRGGADVVYLNTGELLSKKGHEVVFFSTNSTQNEQTKFSDNFVNDIDALKLDFVRQIFSAPRKLFSLEAKNKLGRLINYTEPDVAHIHLYKGGLTSSILTVLKKLKIPTVITLHDYSLLCPRNIFLDSEYNICEKCVNSHTFNCVIKRCNRNNIFYSIINYLEFEVNNRLFKPEKYFEKIICVSRFNFEKHSVKSELRDKLVHLYNFYPLNNNAIPDHNKGRYFLFYGRLSQEKGIITLINAWEKLECQYYLKIVGEGNFLPQIRQKIQMTKNRNIDLIGYKSGEELIQIIKGASYIIVPSEWYENNPMTIIEGYSLGKPIIGSNIGGIPEIINEGKTGFLFKMGQTDDLVSRIKHAYSISEKDYERISINAWQYAQQNFSEDAHYKQLMNIYLEAIKKW